MNRRPAGAMILFFSLFWVGAASAAVEHIPIQANVELNPGQAHTVTVEAAQPTEIGWQAVQAKPCATKCVQATDVTGGISYAIATSLGASMKYRPVSGKITVEYKNISTEPVTINVYRVHRTCEAEACKFLDERQEGRWLVFKIDEFKSIKTSKDDSYSLISGVTIAGKPFSFKAVWWTDEKKNGMVNCAPFVKRYLEKRTPKELYSPYIISGQAVGGAGDIILKSIDTCAPKAPNFGVPEKNVFK